MEKKILTAVDGSEKGFQAVSILGRLLKDQPDVDLVLFHCVQQLAILAPGEVCAISDEACQLPLSAQERLGNAILQEAHKRLTEAGFPETRIQLKLKLDSVDPAQDILKEAESEGIRTIAVGRRGRSQLENLLLGSVSSKVAQYARERAVWIVDTPVHESNNVLVAMEGVPDARPLTSYTAEYLASVPKLRFTLLHLMPPIPPTFWDDGHILGPAEQKDRQTRIDKWRTEWTQRVEKFMDDTRSALKERRVPEKSIETQILPTKEGIARDLLNIISEQKCQVVVMGKRSFLERKPFLLGSHANKVLQNAKGAVICLVDA